MNVIWLIFLHHLADVAFQPSWLIENKKVHWWSIYEHAMVWTFVISVGLVVFGAFSWWKVLFLLVGHFIIDAFRYWKFKSWNYIYLDQALHYAQILFVYYL